MQDGKHVVLCMDDDPDICTFLKTVLDANGYVGQKLSEDEWAPAIAKVMAEECVVGLLHGRMEFGPRALGTRSIIGDARSSKMQSVMNLKIKYRESFRPFAPACLEERVGDFFELDRPSPYMLLVAPVKEERCVGKDQLDERRTRPMREWVNEVRSDIPAITHVDYSARLQTVHQDTNPGFYALLDEFEKQTGCPISVNTSFNVRGEPIVNTPEDAYRCFMRTEMDFLSIGNFLLTKTEQPPWEDAQDWQQEFDLD